jgi:hypothetical protein
VKGKIVAPDRFLGFESQFFPSRNASLTANRTYLPIEKDADGTKEREGLLANTPVSTRLISRA